MINYELWKKLTKWVDESLPLTRGDIFRHALVIKKSTGPLTRGEKEVIEAVWEHRQNQIEKEI